MAVFLIIAAALLLISYIIGSYFVNYAILRKERPSESFNPEDGSSGNTMYEENRKRLEDEAVIFRDNSKCMISYIESEDGLKLKGWYYPNNGSRKCVILVHGYMGDHGNMMTLAAKYHSWGYSVLLPDNRAHGESEGKYIGMGWLCVFAFVPIVKAFSPAGFGWLLAGGLIYTIGGVIYALKLPIFNSRHKNFGSHEIFHLFVMGGSICHFIVMYFFVMPVGA